MPPRSGYTLPVFACAAAVAALQQLKHGRSPASVALDLLEPSEIVEIAIEQVARLNSGMALAVTRSDPGDNLDITRNTPIWALVEWEAAANSQFTIHNSQLDRAPLTNYQQHSTNYQLPITNYQLPRSGH
jgi:cobalt-precorrin-5B (C1)-methyltransferase